jgi:hypothetical protein
MDAFNIDVPSDRKAGGIDYGHSSVRYEMDLASNAPQTIKTRRVFSMMELPTEIRLKVCWALRSVAAEFYPRWTKEMSREKG